MSTHTTYGQFVRAYELFAGALSELAAGSDDIACFSRLAKADPEIKRLKGEMRNVFEGIYVLLARHFELPFLPVHLPLRKKISVRGKTFAFTTGIPTEIRVHPIEAPDAPYGAWRPSDLAISSPVDIFDTFVHEVAHVLEAERTRRMGHGEHFQKARRDIEEVLKKYGFGDVLRSG